MTVLSTWGRARPSATGLLATIDMQLRQGDRLPLVTDGMLERNTADLGLASHIVTTRRDHPAKPSGTWPTWAYGNGAAQEALAAERADLAAVTRRVTGGRGRY
jgi:hypothetical protein